MSAERILPLISPPKPESLQTVQNGWFLLHSRLEVRKPILMFRGLANSWPKSRDYLKIVINVDMSHNEDAQK